MTERRRELLDALVKVQNAPGNEHVDIMTITGFMSDAEVATHLAYYEVKELERQMATKPARRKAVA